MERDFGTGKYKFGTCIPVAKTWTMRYGNACKRPWMCGNAWRHFWMSANAVPLRSIHFNLWTIVDNKELQVTKLWVTTVNAGIRENFENKFLKVIWQKCA